MDPILQNSSSQIIQNHSVAINSSSAATSSSASGSCQPTPASTSNSAGM